MNKKYLFVAVLLFLVVVWRVDIENKNNNLDLVENENYAIDPSDMIGKDFFFPEMSRDLLVEEEKVGLVLMREEEKLARDVYTYLGQKWGQNIFFNIAESEQTHMDAVKFILDRYEIEDPVKDDGVGVFTSADMSVLYKDLTEKGSLSVVDALIVGATIEDLDIKDLDELLETTNKDDIIVTYKNLQKGSRNHIRSFVRVLEKRGGKYSPVYITEDHFNSIISSERESGYVD